MAGPQCCSNPPDLSASCGGGHEKEVGGLRSYITGSEDSKIAVLLVSDVFGYEAPKLRFFLGALPVVRLGSNPDWIQAGVVCHPVSLTEDDMKEVKVPLAIFAAELDEFVPVEEIKRLAHVLAQKPEIESCHKIYPGAVHGWTTRYDDKDEVAVKNADEAHLDMLNWITKYVK